MAGRIDVASEGGVTVVTLDSPGKLNAVSVAMWQGIARVFEERLKSDKEFASSASARLDFFYSKHSSWDERYGLYPVFRD